MNSLNIIDNNRNNILNTDFYNITPSDLIIISNHTRLRDRIFKKTFSERLEYGFGVYVYILIYARDNGYSVREVVNKVYNELMRRIKDGEDIGHHEEIDLINVVYLEVFHSFKTTFEVKNSIKISDHMFILILSKNKNLIKKFVFAFKKHLKRIKMI